MYYIIHHSPQLYFGSENVLAGKVHTSLKVIFK